MRVDGLKDFIEQPQPKCVRYFCFPKQNSGNQILGSDIVISAAPCEVGLPSDSERHRNTISTEGPTVQ